MIDVNLRTVELVTYDTDLDRAREVLLEACHRADGVAAHPGAEVWIDSFGESSINCAVRYWHASDIASRWQVRNAVATAVKRGLDDAGMVTAFPQRTLWFGPGNSTLGVVRQPGGDGSDSPPDPRPSAGCAESRAVLDRCGWIHHASGRFHESAF
ncbi:putative uncharacterized protein [Rhodococcus sp. AW25M09]|nr:mechanosensitive ion channel domain-containing protein [Rhodococcus sp. AW25M09]CCQ14143.1 putative uncharacterized protein [Rhodococcus sp. AW25M09]